jgi:hypothetical protein
MSDLLNKASLVVIPSGYKEDTVYSVVPTDGAGDLSFTRASNGTRINSAGLVEVCPWNLAEQSETFDNATWVKTTDGQVTISANAANAGFHCVAQTQSLVAGVYTISVYAKASEYTFLQIFDSLTTDFANFNLTTGAVATVDQYTATIENVGNGWYRCTASKSNPSGNFVFRYGIVTTGTATRGESFTGNGVNGLFIWGAQLNIGSTAKPYFPTTDRLNVPRLTYQNGGGGCPSLLLEKQSTNLVTYSEQFDNAAWNKATNSGTLTVTANYAISPDGTQNADRIQMSITSGVSNYSQIYQQINVTNNQTYTWSIWLKSLSGTPTIGWSYNGSTWNVITLTNEWVRYTFTSTANGATVNADLILYGSIATSTSADILAWGFQIEQSSYPTSYIPTTSASATRVADACFKTGISSLIGQTEGVMFAEINVPSIATAGNYSSWQLNDGSTSNLIDFTYYSTGRIQAIAFIGGSLQVNIDLTSFGLTAGNHKIAFAYKLNDYVLYVDGVQVGSDTSAQVPAMSKCDLFTGSNQITIYNQFAVFPTRLTNAELASLTTI